MPSYGQREGDQPRVITRAVDVRGREVRPGSGSRERADGDREGTVGRDRFGLEDGLLNHSRVAAAIRIHPTKMVGRIAEATEMHAPLAIERGLVAAASQQPWRGVPVERGDPQIGNTFHGTLTITQYVAAVAPGVEFDESTVMPPAPIVGVITGTRVTVN